MLILAFALVVSMSGSARATCACHLHPQHRTGSFVIIVSGAKSYVLGSKFYISITTANGEHSPPLPVGPTSAARSFSLTAVTPAYTSVEHDKALPAQRTRTISAGGRFTFPPKALQDWGLLGYRTGTYRVSLAYDYVDSNVFTFAVHR
jgi:hypothetical protein